MTSTQPVPTAYLVGICGAGMKALAELLQDRGWRISGSDLQSDSQSGSALRARGITVFPHHADTQIPPETQLLVYSSAVRPSNPERQWAVARNVRQLAYHEMLGELMREKTGICITGTHGKSTTTALTGHLLQVAGLQPSVMIGAESCTQAANGWSGSGSHLVAESCEYQRHFLHLSPRLAAILGIEEDHFDCFADLPATIEAFHQFAKLVPPQGLLIVPQDSAPVGAAVRDLATRIETFAVDREGPAEALDAAPDTVPDWQARRVLKLDSGHQFDLYYRGEFIGSPRLTIPGRHHIGNALAAAALAWHAGASFPQICEGLETFRGIRRRFERLADYRSTIVIDDYAHHPTAIAATLRTATEEFPDRRLLCVFQPHQVSRTRGLLDQFAHCFHLASQVWLVPVYGAREEYRQELSEVSMELAELIAATGVTSAFSPSLDLTRASLDDTLRPGDVLVTLGAGDIDRIHHALTR